MIGKFKSQNGSRITITGAVETVPTPTSDPSQWQTFTLSSSIPGHRTTEVFLNGAASTLGALQAGDIIKVSGNPVVRIDATR